MNYGSLVLYVTVISIIVSMTLLTVQRFVYDADRLRGLGEQAEHGRTVLLAYRQPIKTKTQSGYAYFLQNLEQVYSDTKFEIGSVFQSE